MPIEIPFIRPHFPQSSEIAVDIDEIVASNQFTNFGPTEEKFGRALEQYVGQDLHVSTFSSGTAALIAAVNCVFGRGDGSSYVLMPSFTFIAVAQACIWNGFAPWFIDIDPFSWQCSADSASEILESSREGVVGILLPNCLGVGHPDIVEWERLAAAWDLPLIIDSAAGFGSSYPDGQLLGGRGRCEIFSFHATKPFAIGEGGAVVSRDPELVEQVSRFQNFGFDDDGLCTQLGMNGKLSEISAAIGLRQLNSLDERLESRREVFAKYRCAFSNRGVTFQPNAAASSLFCATICAESPAAKRSLMQSLNAHRVQTREYYNPPLHRHPYFLSNRESRMMGALSVTEDFCSRVISLPIHDRMADGDVDRVIRAVQDGLPGE